jgi:hypothetical protein
VQTERTCVQQTEAGEQTLVTFKFVWSNKGRETRKENPKRKTKDQRGANHGGKNSRKQQNKKKRNKAIEFGEQM